VQRTAGEDATPSGIRASASYGRSAIRALAGWRIWVQPRDEISGFGADATQ
jgi:hypothetical protein